MSDSPDPVSKKNRTVLLVEDHEATRVTLAGVVEREGCKVTSVASAGAAREKLREEEFDLVVTDMRLPDGDGMDLLTEAKRLSAGTPVILITGHGSEETAVQAMKQGAFNYLAKPLDLHRLRAELENAFRWRTAQLQTAELQQEVLTRRRGDSELIGVSPAILRVKEKIRQIGPTHATVLLSGESGVGKEVVAGALQAASDRAGKPFVKVNVAALPRDLLESELFGHERGAFTSAVRARKGRFELADGGTMFLDEIAECPPEVQVKLLRVLQEQEFERVGGSDTIRTDVRMICATNKDLKKEMAEKRFREDLYFRINVIQIQIPPLRERREDIEALVPHFLRQHALSTGHVKQIGPAAMQLLLRYAWPGNVRELKNALEHACLLTPGDTIAPDSLPEDVLEGGGAGAALGSSASQKAVPTGDGLFMPLDLSMDAVEQRYILAVFEKAKGNKTLTAKMLGIGLKTLYRKLVKYGVMKPSEGEAAEDER
ncbi:MAG: sigma-54-dependent Fis family transcriptional regulator [Planctomycetes bacterium]|nr:sigma-54-dependent Fis family transcriptional regulator [Planctomycetota bacterium]